MAYEQLKKHLQVAEGLELRPYRDSLGKLTIGVGRLIDPEVKGSKPLPPGVEEITREVALKWLDEDVEEKVQELRHTPRVAIFDALDEERQEIVVDCCFQLGVAGFSGWNGFWRAADSRDWNRAADELLDSTAAEQTTGRFFERAARMRNPSNPQPDLEMLPPNRQSEQRKYASRTRGAGTPPLRLPSESETADAPVTVESTEGQVIEVPPVGAVSAVQPVVDDGADFGAASVAKKAERAYRIARDLGITRTEKEFSELAPEFQIRWALYSERMKS